jgi:membrane protease YdiL (CAAX protease family)
LNLVDLGVLLLGPTLFTAVFLVNPAGDLVSSMACVAPILALTSSLRIGFPRLRSLLALRVSHLIAGGLAAIALHVVFLVGREVSELLSLLGYIESIYASVQLTAYTPLLLILIAIAEELYWRGWLQETLLSGLKLRWVVSSLVYSASHATSLNPVLVAAALAAGAILGLTAKRFGLSASIVAHAIWVEIAFYVTPYHSTA